MPTDGGWWADDDPHYRDAEWTITFGQQPKPEPKVRLDLWDNDESEQKFFKEMRERLGRKSDQEE